MFYGNRIPGIPYFMGQLYVERQYVLGERMKICYSEEYGHLGLDCHLPDVSAIGSGLFQGKNLGF